ncbi:hypothetical protein Rsub_03953 [Raphidocelis subcapitata]|uniref:Uncharacterized protein n=1 Tax=Raphidocelis subcapitata TaxID=307507 RepID=A0A2V0NWE1_9CHLO|nr:hypothetical protein Rsub_03953 [Raphidocelis subcapitata]|eukprot:GBF91649.1 hypothetical protein Rsub_03953 [Raphidocelis subcapitata]
MLSAARSGKLYRQEQRQQQQRPPGGPPARRAPAAPERHGNRAPRRCAPGRLPPIAAAAAAAGADGGGAGASAPPVDAWDVIEWREAPARGGRLRLGLVAEVRGGVVLVEPLVEEEEGIWAHDGAAGEAPQPVEAADVLRVVEFDLQSRQDRVGPGNPHGEHAHDVFIPLVQLSDGVFRSPEGR